MDETQVIDFTREAIMLTIKISAPVMLVGLVRGLPDKEEREAAEGGALPLSTQQTAPN